MRLQAMRICQRKAEPLAHMYIAFLPWDRSWQVPLWKNEMALKKSPPCSTIGRSHGERGTELRAGERMEVLGGGSAP